MTAVGLRQQGSEAVGPRSNLCRIRYFHDFTDIYQKFHFNDSHGTVGRTTWFWSGRSGFESLSCQILLWFHWHLTQIPMVPLAQWVGQQGFEAVDTGLNPSLYRHFLTQILRRKIVISPLLCIKIFRYTKFSETPKGSPKNFFGTVRQKIFDRKSGHTPLMHKILRSPKLVKTKRFP